MFKTIYRWLTALIILSFSTFTYADLRVVVVAGQSNAVGDGNMNGKYREHRLRGKYLVYANPYPSVLYSEKIIHRTSFLTLREVVDGPVQPYASNDWQDGRFGVELSLARHIDQARPAYWSENDTVVMLKFAVGGTNISRWLPTDTSGLHQQFDNWLETKLLALQNYGQPIHLEYFVWIQGEANTGNGASTYEARYRQLIDYLDNKTGGFSKSIFAKLKRWPNDPSRDAAIDLINSDMEANHLTTDDTNILRFQTGEVHYWGIDYMRLGKMIGRALLASN